MSKSPMVNMDALFDSDVESDEDEYLSSNSSTSSNMKPLNNASTRKLPKPSTNPPLPPETPAAKQSRYKKKVIYFLSSFAGTIDELYSRYKWRMT